MFVSCTDKPAGDPLVALAARLRASGWPVRELPTEHFAMLTMPSSLAELLSQIGVEHFAMLTMPSSLAELLSQIGVDRQSDQ